MWIFGSSSYSSISEWVIKEATFSFHFLSHFLAEKALGSDSFFTANDSVNDDSARSNLVPTVYSLFFVDKAEITKILASEFLLLLPQAMRTSRSFLKMGPNKRFYTPFRPKDDRQWEHPGVLFLEWVLIGVFMHLSGRKLIRTATDITLTPYNKASGLDCSLATT